jgi:hypothetical protein
MVFIKNWGTIEQHFHTQTYWQTYINLYSCLFHTDSFTHCCAFKHNFFTFKPFWAEALVWPRKRLARTHCQSQLAGKKKMCEYLRVWRFEWAWRCWIGWKLFILKKATHRQMPTGFLLEGLRAWPNEHCCVARNSCRGSRRVFLRQRNAMKIILSRLMDSYGANFWFLKSYTGLFRNGFLGPWWFTSFSDFVIKTFHSSSLPILSKKGGPGIYPSNYPTVKSAPWIFQK